MNGGKWETLIMHMIIDLFTHHQQWSILSQGQLQKTVVGVPASGSSDGCYMQCVCWKNKAFPLFWVFAFQLLQQ